MFGYVYGLYSRFQVLARVKVSSVMVAGAHNGVPFIVLIVAESRVYTALLKLDGLLPSKHLVAANVGALTLAAMLIAAIVVIKIFENIILNPSRKLDPPLGLNL